MIFKNKPNRCLIAIFLLSIMSGAALADDERVKVVDGKTYFNGTEAEARAYMHTQIEATRAKAQAEADAKSQVWRERMDAANSGRPDANFEADNKANYDLWAASHPAEVAQGVREQAALAARGAQMAEAMKADAARTLEEFHQKMLAEGKVRGLDGEKMFQHALGRTTEDPYKNEVVYKRSDAQVSTIVANMRAAHDQEVFEASQNMHKISENPMTSNGTPVGLSDGFTPTETVKTSIPPADKKKEITTQVVEVKISKPLVSYDTAHQDSNQKK